MNLLKTLCTLVLILTSIYFNAYSQEVPIINYSTDLNGQVQLEVESTPNTYYILNIRHNTTGEFDLPVSMTKSTTGTTIISEPLGAYPLEHYQVLEHSLMEPVDTDGDGDNDLIEFSDIPMSSPLNYAASIDFDDGSVMVESMTTFKALSIDDQDVGWSPFLNDQEFTKFVIDDMDTDQPRLYFINSNTHFIHQSFGDQVGIDTWADDVVKGEIVFYPTVTANNGTLGVFAFNFTFGDLESFEWTQKTYELIAANMPFLKNNLSYFVLASSQNEFDQNLDQYEDSRVSILYENDIYADIDYLALNIAEGFGYFRLMDLEETPSSRDVVFYETIPNSLPRVGGIMTSFIQTPLSHVNLRAIQDNVPNAFIREPLMVDSIANLLNKYIYYRVEQDEYFIREATLDEVNAWFEAIRPDEEQTPALNLSYTSILPLDEITFDMADGFGAKCTNVATMRDFGFPENTIPDGFGIPFYFYQEFMEYNDFFTQVEEMLADPNFIGDLDTRVEMLKDFRKEIREADMPPWMLNELQAMHDAFPEGTAVRCRSSTNNEDLPGFSGAGLYTSKTQHLDEGHISKSVKQVYASMWNFRAYDERDFYRVDQYVASMGILCHPNYSDEKANGVGVSLDPIYQTEDTYYLNTQLGEELVTNPENNSIPEEILLDIVSLTEDDYVVIRYSNLVANDVLIMEEEYLDQMREYLTIIHDEFEILYDVNGGEGFGMDIEYKITVEDQLIIKQARPWASYWSELDPIISTSLDYLTNVNMSVFPNPTIDYLNVQCDDCEEINVRITNLAGQLMLEQSANLNNADLRISTKNLPKGTYIIYGIGKDGENHFTKKIVKT